MAYCRIEPFGQTHTEYMLAQQACILANVNRAEGVSAFDVSDFMPSSKHQNTNEHLILLDDPEQQSNLIISAIFGIDNNG